MEGNGREDVFPEPIKLQKIEERGEEERRREETDSSVEGRSHRVSKGASKRLNRTET